MLRTGNLRIFVLFISSMCATLIFISSTIYVRNTVLTVESGQVVKVTKSLEMKRAEKDINRRIKEGNAKLENLSQIIKQNSNVLPNIGKHPTATKLCSSNSSQCVSPFRQAHTTIVVAPKYRMLNCLVYKSMSAIMTSAMCYLYDEKAFIDSNREFIYDWANYRFCKNKNEYFSVQSAEENLNISLKESGWSVTMIVRDPIERFISGFVDKCVRRGLSRKPCNNCGTNLTCFIIAEYQKMMTLAKNKQIIPTLEDFHFTPQSWHCNLDTNFETYEFLKMSNDPSEVIDRVFDIGRKQNVPEESLSYLEKQIKKPLHHTTAQSPAREYLEMRLRSSPYLMQYLVKMYYHDFVLFNYSFPKDF